MKPFLSLVFLFAFPVNPVAANEYNNAGFPSCERTREDPCMTVERQTVFRDSTCAERARQSGIDASGNRTTFISIEQYYVCKSRKRDLQSNEQIREYGRRSDIAVRGDAAYQRAVKTYTVRPGGSIGAPPGYYFIPPTPCNDGMWVALSSGGFSRHHLACTVGKGDQREGATFMNQSRQAVTIEAHPFFE